MSTLCRGVEAPTASSTHTRAGTADETFRRRLAAALLLLFVAFAVAAAAARGPWLDEIFTLWQSRSGIALGDAFERWRADFHPPLFSALQWLLSLGAGDALLAHRLLNLLPLAWAALFTVAALRQRPPAAALTLSLAVVLLSLPPTLEYFAEARSYFMQLCLFYVVLVGAVVVLESDDDLDWRRDGPFAAMLLPSIVVALNLHYLSTLLTGLLLAGTLALCLWRGQRRWALALAVAGAIGCMLVAAALASHARYLADGARNFWITGSMEQALRILLQRVAASVRANPVAALAAAVAGAATVVSLWRGADRPRPGEGVAAAALPARRWATVAMLCAVLLLFAAVMLAAHARQPIVIARYLVTFQVLAAGIVACLCAHLVVRRRWIFAAMVVAALVRVAGETAETVGERRWDASAQDVATLAARCPQAAVQAAVVPRAANVPAVIQWGYQWQARRLGFEVATVQPGQRVEPPTGAGCPLLLWVEHVGRDMPADPAAALRLLRLEPVGVDLQHARLTTAETGFVLQLPPLR